MKTYSVELVKVLNHRKPGGPSTLAVVTRSRMTTSLGKTKRQAVRDLRDSPEYQTANVWECENHVPKQIVAAFNRVGGLILPINLPEE